MSRPTHRGCALVITEPLIHSEVGVWWASVFMFIVVQSLSRVRLFATPWTAAHQASLSFTISQSVLKLMSIESMMPSTVSSCHPLLLLPSVFSSISVFSIRVSVFTFIFFLVTRKSSSQLPRKNAQKPQEVRQIKSHYIHQLPQRPTMAQNVKKLLRGPVERRTTFSDENNKVGGSLDVSRTRVYACIPESGFYCGNICGVLVLQVSIEPLLGAMNVLSPNHWTTKELRNICVLWLRCSYLSKAGLVCSIFTRAIDPSAPLRRNFIQCLVSCQAGCFSNAQTWFIFITFRH